LRNLGFTILISLCLWGIIIGLILLAVKSCDKRVKKKVMVSPPIELKVDISLFDDRILLLKSDRAREGVMECGKKLAGHVPDPIGFVLIMTCIESDFGEQVNGKSGEIGIMQIHPYWLKRTGLSHTNLKDDYTNICFAVDLLKDYFQKYNDVFLVIKAYNRGEKNLINKNHNAFYLKRFFECADRVNWQKIKFE
jgi:hypothetical protein